MSGAVKATLWFAAIIVGLLFLAAVWKLTVRYGPKRVRPVRGKQRQSSAIAACRHSARFTVCPDSGPNPAHTTRGS